MKVKDIKIGTRLELTRSGKTGKEHNNVLISQFLDFNEDGSVTISAPIYGTRLISISVGTKLTLSFLHSEQGILGFDGLVTEDKQKERVPTLVIIPVSGIKKVQRRSHYRLDWVEDVRLLLPDSITDNPEKKMVKCSSRNISGAGVCVISDKSIPINSIVEIELDLERNGCLKLKCAVMRNNEIEIKKSRLYELGLEFLDIPRETREKIIRFIFTEQRARLKNSKNT